ncbi:MAG: hypothetical protein ACPG7F_01165 [Aggregatilineales bacterium]
MINLNELLGRIAALAEECMSGISVNADAVPYFYHVQESHPYFTARIRDAQIAPNSEDFDLKTLNVQLWLVIGNVGSGVDGERESEMYTWIPQLTAYVNNRDWLQTVAGGTYPDPMENLIQARVVSWQTLATLQSRGSRLAEQIGVQFNIQCQFIDDVDPAYT